MSSRTGSAVRPRRSILASGCAGSYTQRSTATDPGSLSSYRGETVSAIDGRPISGVAVKVGTRAAVSDENGRFELNDLQEAQRS